MKSTSILPWNHARMKPFSILCERIVKFGANRVIYLATDPDIRTNGKGKLLMEEAGIKCIESSIYKNENSEILKGYLKQKTGLPISH